MSALFVLVFEALFHVNVGQPKDDAPLGGWTSVGEPIVMVGAGGGDGGPGWDGVVGVMVCLPHATAVGMSTTANRR
jgi:hypothetical protein